ncbi:hypothetical protein DSCOOX_28060 [Desulfosarcina ovata subsp. ovata]|uniref:Type I restriction modification DNA specificity domain-containing protein n=1 Tax=Desulfosarcina ovata subsp. ovata TaxID=2752305 RepID=A0A5K8AAT5_9BACT|nr:hypothetical protein DSCOOX_28060 [Desulfosarcina ovata subsp. ovata]
MVFLYYTLKNRIDQLQAKGKGATFKELSKADVKRFKIPLPPLNDQIRIATLLSRVDALIAKRKENLRLLDEFLKSTFLAMFGDPVQNSKGWKKRPLRKLLSAIESGWSPKCENRQAEEDEWGVLKLGAVTACNFLEIENKALPQSVVPKPEKEVKNGDLLFSRKNTYQLVAACAYIFNTRPHLMMSDLIFRLVVQDKNIINPISLWRLLINPKQRGLIQSLAGGAAGSMPNISKQKLMSVSLPVPPIEAQNQFAEIVKKVENLKSIYLRNLRELENLYVALSQKAFKGELDLSRIPLEKVFEPQIDYDENESEAGTPSFTSLEHEAISDPEERKRLLRQIFEDYFTSEPKRFSSFSDFWSRVEFNILDYMNEESPPLGIEDYDQVKVWLFEHLKRGEVEQTFNEHENQIKLRPKS